MQAEQLIAEARKAEAEARHHKRAERQHRLAAQAARRRQAEIEAQCQARGISIIHSPKAAVAPDRRYPGTPAQSTNPAQENIHGHNRPTARPSNAH
ncbi:hypothetical protein [Pelagibacterium halotolerans]|uniref:Uncharacterized protein n=1 Tax=Pelagibacterium halotolerans (strain DSM 22347 / JCM 15775 / CGMCC 1.7692 / B2) TaxID=1082931 RepID=G4RDC3_PELHB|nr:hypothetical protein [Pelagibacterium halotolerans]AEQ50749.1 hypothetical protein KKY_710 [Pelagibacterium halotolerans B2]QJR19331.1 hypothetical protein HKM20_13310 [Pelagibacterium halotolerans]SDZ94799.1 hypothetical protein SAMN05428936_101636 [Pelagibacterium halotolerans]